MAAETITLVLDGDIGLDDYQTAIKSLRDLVHELHEAVVSGAVIDWYIERLDTGSAVTTLRAEARCVDAFGSISAAYLSIGEAIEGNRPIPYGQRIQYPALTIANLIDGRVTGVRFETALAEAIIHERPQRNRIVQEPKLVSRGAVAGVIQTLSNRKGLRFTLYDTLHDRAVSCYLRAEQDEIMRDVWGKRAIVEGMINRDPRSGRAISIRQITNVEVMTEREPGAYRRARGVSPRRGDDKPEDLIRRVRDA